MKRILLPIFLLCAIVVFCSFSTHHVAHICETTISLLEQAETRCTLGDFRGAESLCQAARTEWKRHEGFLGTALRHTESDDVDVCFPALMETAAQRDRDEFLRKNLELRAALRCLYRMELPYYFNVL